jgi:hypothetical protein
LQKGENGLNSKTKARLEQLHAQFKGNPAITCKVCGNPIHEAITGKYDTEGGTLCRICFSEAIGNEIDEHPLRSMPPKKIPA